MTKVSIALGSMAVLTSLPTLAQISENGGRILGTDLGRSLTTTLGESLGAQLPFEVGGLAAISALTLIVGVQLIKRRK